jgi:hypothetical protein
MSFLRGLCSENVYKLFIHNLDLRERVRLFDIV